jgi:hypothetical protein
MSGLKLRPPQANEKLGVLTHFYFLADSFMVIVIIVMMLLGRIRFIDCAPFF